MPSRRKTREFVLQVLFAADFTDHDPEETLQLLEDHFASDDDEPVRTHRVMSSFAHELVSAFSRDQEAIDQLIMRLSKHWKLYRMTGVDRNLLRMAVTEMICIDGTPGRVVLDEAVEIGKRYGTDHSASFVNGILDRVHTLGNLAGSKRKLSDILKELDQDTIRD